MKKIIIIWATSGIWEQVAKDMVERWYVVGVTWRREQQLVALQKEYGAEKIKISNFDITDTELALQKIEKLVEKLGGVDIFLLSSWTWKENTELDFNIEYEVIKTNIIGRTNLMDRATRYFIKQKKWHIVAITSISALRGMDSCPNYNATKAYQSNYIESLRLNIDKRKLPIDVLEVQPWFIQTKMAQWNLFWVTPVAKASKQILHAIQKKKRHIYVSKKRRLIARVMKVSSYKLYKKIINGI